MSMVRALTSPRRAVLSVAALVTAAGLGGGLVPAPAAAHAALVRPKAVKVVGVGRSSLTVTARARAPKYRLWAAHRRHQLGSVRIRRTGMASPVTRTPRVTLGSLRYTTRPYFYRIEVIDGGRHRYSPIEGPVGLQPPAPTHLSAATSPLGGVSLSWDSGKATGYVVTQAGDAAMTQDVVTYRIDNDDRHFTPGRVQPGTTYYFQVRAVNDQTTSPPSPVVAVRAQSDQQPLRVMTYNIRKATSDGRVEGGNVVAPWSQRRAGVVSLVQQAAPDVLAVQEGAAVVAAKTRQVDDLVAALGGGYRLAQTEIPPTQRGHTVRSGDYVVYDSATVTPVGDGGHWSIGDGQFAAYQEFKSVPSGAAFLFVSTHLQVTGQPGGTDAGRTAEDKSMVLQATAYDATHGGLPIVYAGDFNSDPSHAHLFNGPSDYNLSTGLSDAYDVAESRHDAQYNSANGYHTRPPSLGLRIDYVFVSPGVAVSHWELLLDLVHGRFPGIIPSDHNPIVADLLVPYVAVS